VTALDVIIDTRRALAFTYQLALFLNNDKIRGFFEFLQTEVSANLERLDDMTD